MDDPIVLVRHRGDRDADRALLAEAAALVLGVASETASASAGEIATEGEGENAGIVVTRSCAHCGATDHGQPRAPGVFLSLSRAGDMVAVAATRRGPIGIDIESLERVASAGFDDVAFTAEERAAIARSADPGMHRAVLWTSKEALLKSTGDGLRTDPRLLRIGDARELLSRPASESRLDGAVLSQLETPPGYVGTIAILAGGTLTE